MVTGAAGSGAGFGSTGVEGATAGMGLGVGVADHDGSDLTNDDKRLFWGGASGM